MTEEYRNKGAVTPPQSRDRRPRLSAKCGMYQWKQGFWADRRGRLSLLWGAT